MASDFNPRSPRGERPPGVSAGALHPLFQSTLPARGATRRFFVLASRTIFQSTLPARGATLTDMGYNVHILDFNPRSPRGERPDQRPLPRRPSQISIHAPREGSDAPGPPSTRWRSNFNPRSPRGERPISCFNFFILFLFQSTLPARGATLAAPSHCL